MANAISVSSGPYPFFCLAGPRVEYRFHVDEPSGDLIHDHFGAPTGTGRTRVDPPVHGWGGPLNESCREFPDHGRGDFRLPAIRVRHGQGRGHTVTRFIYESHTIVQGKARLEALPSTFGAQEEASTLVVHLRDATANLSVDLRYSVFPDLNTIVRSFSITNDGTAEVEVERAASFSVDMNGGDWDMVYMSGDWTREGIRGRRRVDNGTQGFQSSTGYSSHYYNPFVSLVDPQTTDTLGPAYGWSLVYSGSFSADIEKSSAHGRTRVMLGLNPLHLSWPLASKATFQSPEVCAVYEHTYGLGGMSRSFHSLYRNHLSRSAWTKKERPVLINNWEATYFDIDSKILHAFAERAAALGIRMFVMDDGWFGDKKPRTSDIAGLGDWKPNPARFSDGLEAFISGITSLESGNSGNKMKFGIWVEPEMVNPDSELYDLHPDWVLSVDGYKRTEQRNQLVLDLGKREVQDYIIDCISKILSSADISYVKWDNNRGMHEIPHPSYAHAYILGLYRVLDALTTRFPDVLWEGCASGGGRFDPGLLHYWPQHWTSDNTDALERLAIQFGNSLVYPPSSMGCHVSACPNEQVQRTTPLRFRAHVALMGGSFGFELDLAHLEPAERDAIPGIVELAERVNPFVINGDQYRLVLPEASNWPAVLYLQNGGKEGVIMAYQVREVPRSHPPSLRLQGLEDDATYEVQQEGSETVETLTGSALMNSGLFILWHGDYDSRVYWLRKKTM